jgi:hypothetical protein
MKYLEYVVVAEEGTNDVGHEMKNAISIVTPSSMPEEDLANLVSKIYVSILPEITFSKNGKGYNFESSGAYIGHLEYKENNPFKKFILTTNPNIAKLILNSINERR